jgi:hypothetical protein
VDGALADRAYRAVLDRCPLADAHRTALQKRGLTDEQIQRHGYGTTPATPSARRGLAAAVSAEVAHALAGAVPGFVRDEQGILDLACGQGELMLASRAVDGRINGLRRRLDAPQDGGKYRWLSAGDDGTRSVRQDGHTVHVGRPERDASPRRVVVCEGEIKGNITADRVGCVVLSVPGVASIGGVLPVLAELGVEDVTIAYDADAATNPQVAHHETRLAHLLIDAGYRVDRWEWRIEDGKGIDDLLVAGRLPFAASHPALRQPRRIAETTPPPLDEHRQAVAMNKARARIQRNVKLPARPMAAAVLGVFAQAATAVNPAGGFRVPAGFTLAPVSTLAYDAGTGTTNAGGQLKKLDEAGLISRHTVPDTLPPGTPDPETGELLKTPRRIERHFIAIKGHEHEPITPAVWAELVERMARYDSALPERRGGLRIPRCPEHPHAKVARHWTANCGECNKQLYPAPGSEAVDEIPPMLLVPAPTVDQSLVDRAEAITEPDPDDDDDTPFSSDTPGIRPIAHKDRGTVCPNVAVHQTLGDREIHATMPEWDGLSEDERRALAHITLEDWQDRSAPPADPDPAPPLTLFPLDDASCVGCGAIVAEGQTYCRRCDPRTA